VNASLGRRSARRLLAGRGSVPGSQSAGVEEEARREDAGNDGDHHSDNDDAAAGKHEGQRVEVHIPTIVDLGGGGEIEAKVTRTLDRRRFLILIGAGLATACTPIAQTSPSPTASAIHPLRANPTRGIWPAQYHAATQPVRDAYAWAATHENILQYIPCYCGCGASGHRNNYDCFVRAKAASGWITMDLHGLNCGTCVSITLETSSMTAKGLTLRQMRTAIDARWSATGPSTPTPLP
jgi:hypothetical protein